MAASADIGLRDLLDDVGLDDDEIDASDVEADYLAAHLFVKSHHFNFLDEMVTRL